jgi:hypothetical protein
MGQSRAGPNYGGIVDRRARVLRIDGLDHRPLALLFTYSCHATTKAGSEGFISPDYPGIARSEIEARLECPALFMQGCCGNIRPAILSPEGGFTSASVEQLAACGKELGAEVCRVAESLCTHPAMGLESRLLEIQVPFGEVLDLQSLTEIATASYEPHVRYIADWADEVIEKVREGSLPAAKRTEMQMVRIGPLCCVGIPGEPVQEIGHAIEKAYRGALGSQDIWPVGYVNDEIGYLCTDLHHQQGGYEPGTAYRFYNEPAPFVNEERAIVEAAGQLFGKQG